MRRGFTLVEIIVAITIFSIAVLLLYRVTETLRISNASLEHHSSKIEGSNKLLEVMKLDFLYTDDNQTTVLEGRIYDAISFRSRHSLYGISNPYISYWVSKDKRLWRIESSLDLNFTIKDEHLMYMKFDELKSDMAKFKVYDGNGTKLLFLEEKEKEPLLLELSFSGTS